MICNKCNRELPDDALICCYCGKKIVVDHHARKRGNGTGTVYRRRDTGTWEAKITLGMRITAEGKLQQVRKTKSGFKTKKEALEYIQGMYNSIEKTVPTVGKLWDDYQEAGFSKLSESKRTAYRIAWNRWKPLEFMSVDALTVADLQRTVNTATSTHYPAKDMKDLMSNLLKAAEIDGFCKNLAQYIILPEKAEVIPNPFTPEEQRKLWEDYAAGSWWTGYILLMIYTSMMPGELLSCRKNQIDLEAHTITGAGKKTAVRKSSAIVLPDIIIPVIDELMERTPGEKLIRINKDNFYKQFHETLKRIGCREELTPYSCRHTTATALVRADIQPSVIQKIMRHAKFSSTQRYIHVAPSDAIEAVNKLA